MLRVMAPFPLQPNVLTEVKRWREAVDYRRMCGTGADIDLRMAYCYRPGVVRTVDSSGGEDFHQPELSAPVPPHPCSRKPQLLVQRYRARVALVRVETDGAHPLAVARTMAHATSCCLTPRRRVADTTKTSSSSASRSGAAGS
jgi:hypothetical protein